MRNKYLPLLCDLPDAIYVLADHHATKHENVTLLGPATCSLATRLPLTPCTLSTMTTPQGCQTSPQAKRRHSSLCTFSMEHHKWMFLSLWLCIPPIRSCIACIKKSFYQIANRPCYQRTRKDSSFIQIFPGSNWNQLAMLRPCKSSRTASQFKLPYLQLCLKGTYWWAVRSQWGYWKLSYVLKAPSLQSHGARPQQFGALAARPCWCRFFLAYLLYEFGLLINQKLLLPHNRFQILYLSLQLVEAAVCSGRRGFCSTCRRTVLATKRSDLTLWKRNSWLKRS